jgi:hypothetical protein
MMQPVVRIAEPYSGPDNPLRHPRVTLFPKCGHITRRDYTPGRIWVKIRCEMCSYLYKEREAKNEKRARKMKRRRARLRKQQIKVERLNMAKKKMASKKVTKKKDLKTKKNKGVKPGRKLTLVAQHVWAPKGSLLSKILKAMQVAEKATMGENELVVAMEKAGAKAEGKKTVKKLVKGMLRNMLRAGVVVKQREIKNNDELSEFISSFKKSKSDDDEEDGDDDEESDEEDSDEEGDGDDDDETEEGDGEEADGDDEEEKPKAKKKVVKKKTKK